MNRGKHSITRCHLCAPFIHSTSWVVLLKVNNKNNKVQLFEVEAKLAYDVEHGT